jgi:hypothetical protein
MERHPKLTETGEAALINAVKSGNCPYCQHDGISGFGQTKMGFRGTVAKPAKRPLHPYLNLFSFTINPPVEHLEKVKILLNLALNTRKTLRYRSLFRMK